MGDLVRRNMMPLQARAPDIGGRKPSSRSSAATMAALLIAARPLGGRPSAAGSAIAIGIFLTTLSFLFSTPGTWEQVPDFPLPEPGAAAGFLLKDGYLLGAAVWCPGEALSTREAAEARDFASLRNSPGASAATKR